jgi:hypothetical protein
MVLQEEQLGIQAAVVALVEMEVIHRATVVLEESITF